MNQQTRRKARILIVDDDPGLLRLLTIRLRAENYEVEAVEGAAQALASASRFRPDLVISDLSMEPVDGIGLLKDLQVRWPGLKVILLTAHGTIPDAVQATQMGAFGFPDQAGGQTGTAGPDPARAQDFGLFRHHRGMACGDHHPQRHHGGTPCPGTYGGGHRCARVDHRGKRHRQELLARALHRASPRRTQPFIVASCATISEEQTDVDLFGAGASTGQERPGAFQNAEGGTLLLDDVGDLPPRLQQKLLRTLQDEAVLPVGSTTDRPVNVRVISTTRQGHATDDSRRCVPRGPLLPAQRRAD